MWRVEDKYCYTEIEMAILYAKLKTILQKDSNSKADYYRVTSLYFDDYTNRNLFESDSGESKRKKYRIRVYDGNMNNIRLEVKTKKYNRVFKRSCKINIEDARCLVRGIPIRDDKLDLGSPITLFNLGIKSCVLRPRIIVDYKRSAFVFAPGKVRITLDSEIRFSQNIHQFLSGECSYTQLSEMNRIVEVKYDAFIPAFIKRVLENGNMLQIAFSKYKLCMEQLDSQRVLSMR